jgi:hypothetical protein
MSNQHLRDIKAVLERNHWRVQDELSGDDHGTSAVWRVARPDGADAFHLEFQGLDDMETRPIERAYGINVREAPEIAAYLARVSRTWPTELAQFIANLEQWAHNKRLQDDARNARA